MLGFPPYLSVTFALSGAILIFGLLGAIQAFFEWRTLVRGWREAKIIDQDAPRKKESLQLVLLTLGAPLFIFAGSLSIIWSNWEIYQYRNLLISKVTGAVVEKVESPYSGPSARKRFENVDALRQGLTALSGCSGEVMFNHESPRDGYVIRLETDGELEPIYSITVYRKTSSSENKTSVSAAGDSNYLCSTFQTWVTENIDTLFTKNIDTNVGQSSSPAPNR